MNREILAYLWPALGSVVARLEGFRRFIVNARRNRCISSDQTSGHRLQESARKTSNDTGASRPRKERHQSQETRVRNREERIERPMQSHPGVRAPKHSRTPLVGDDEIGGAALPYERRTR